MKILIVAMVMAMLTSCVPVEPTNEKQNLLKSNLRDDTDSEDNGFSKPREFSSGGCEVFSKLEGYYKDIIQNKYTGDCVLDELRTLPIDGLFSPDFQTTNNGIKLDLTIPISPQRIIGKVSFYRLSFYIAKETAQWDLSKYLVAEIQPGVQFRNTILHLDTTIPQTTGHYIYFAKYKFKNLDGEEKVVVSLPSRVSMRVDSNPLTPGVPRLSARIFNYGDDPLNVAMDYAFKNEESLVLQKYGDGIHFKFQVAYGQSNQFVDIPQTKFDQAITFRAPAGAKISTLKLRVDPNHLGDRMRIKMEYYSKDLIGNLTKNVKIMNHRTLPSSKSNHYSTDEKLFSYMTNNQPLVPVPLFPIYEKSTGKTRFHIDIENYRREFVQGDVEIYKSTGNLGVIGGRAYKLYKTVAVNDIPTDRAIDLGFREEFPGQIENNLVWFLVVYRTKDIDGVTRVHMSFERTFAITN